MHLKVPPRVLHFSAIHCLVCVSVCLSVPALAASAHVLHLQQSRVSRRFFLDLDSWILEKLFKSYAVKKPKCKLDSAYRKPFSRTFRTNETQQLREGQLVGRMLLQRLATGVTSEMQARAYSGQRVTRTRMRSKYIHSVS